MNKLSQNNCPVLNFASKHPLLTETIYKGFLCFLAVAVPVAAFLVVYYFCPIPLLTCDASECRRIASERIWWYLAGLVGFIAYASATIGVARTEDTIACNALVRIPQFIAVLALLSPVGLVLGIFGYVMCTMHNSFWSLPVLNMVTITAVFAVGLGLIGTCLYKLAVPEKTKA